MTTAIDTNVLLDIQTRDPEHFPRSAAALEEVARAGALVVGKIVYAELSVRLPRDDLDRFLEDLGVQYTPCSREALHRAGTAYRAYLANRGLDVHCPHCGASFRPTCPHCDRPVAWRQHLAPDFVVAAHAESTAGTLLSRDRGLYRRYFPGIVKEP